MKIFKKAILLAGSAGTVVAPVAAIMSCGGSAASIDAGIIVYKMSDTFMNSLQQDLVKKTTEYGLKTSVADAEGSNATLITQMEALLGRNPKVLVVNPVNPADIGNIIAKAKAKEVPLILLNKEVKESERKQVMASYEKVWYVGTTATVQGELQAEQIYADIKSGKVRDINDNGKLDFAIARGETGHADAIDRSEANVRKLKELLKTKVKLVSKDGKKTTEIGENDINEYGETQWNDWSSELGLSKVYTPNKDKVDLFISNNDGMAEGIVSGLQNETTFKPVAIPADYPKTEVYDTTKAIPLNHIAVYGVDATVPGKALVKSGWMNATVLNDGKTQGYLVAELVKAIVKENKMPDTSQPFVFSYDPWGKGKTGIQIKNNPDYKAFYADSLAIDINNVDQF